VSAARPTDWSAVDLWADPVPGDPDVVASFGGMMTRTAETIETASQSLRRISYTNVSKASSQVRSQAINVAAQLDRAHSRTSGAGEALTTYADRLREAQKDSEIALRRAQNAVANRRAAEAMREERAKAHNNCLDLRLREQYRDDYERYGRRADQAEAERRQAAQDVVRARDARKAAARSAAQKLGEVQRTSPLNDNFLDRIRSILQKVENWISGFINRIKDAVARIAKAIWDKVNAAWRALVKGVMVVITGLGAIYDRIIRKTLPLINRIRGFYNSNIDKLRRRMILKADESNAPNENEPKGAPSSMSELIDHRSGMDKDDGLRLEEIRCKDGKTRYVLYIDGTESGKGAYYDSHTWPENVPAYAGWRTDTDVRISELLRTHVKPPGSEIMVCGYSQGGLHALALADTGEFKVTQVVNTYSPDMSVPVNLHGAQVINLRDTKEPVGFIRGQSGNQTQNFYGTSDGMSFELDRHVDDGAQKQIVKQFENSTDPRLDSQKREISKYLGGELVRVID
jgi:hypothetical protein